MVRGKGERKNGGGYYAVRRGGKHSTSGNMEEKNREAWLVREGFQEEAMPELSPKDQGGIDQIKETLCAKSRRQERESRLER